jgi:hypothetical protein
MKCIPFETCVIKGHRGLVYDDTALIPIWEIMRCVINLRRSVILPCFPLYLLFFSTGYLIPNCRIVISVALRSKLLLSLSKRQPRYHPSFNVQFILSASLSLQISQPQRSYIKCLYQCEKTRTIHRQHSFTRSPDSTECSHPRSHFAAVPSMMDVIPASASWEDPPQVLTPGFAKVKTPITAASVNPLVNYFPVLPLQMAGSPTSGLLSLFRPSLRRLYRYCQNQLFWLKI